MGPFASGLGMQHGLRALPVFTLGAPAPLARGTVMSDSPTYSSPSFFRSPEFYAVVVGTALALVPILWVDLFYLGVILFAVPAWGGLLAAAFVLGRAGVLRPMRAILVGLAIGVLAPGTRYVLTELGAVRAFADSPWIGASYEQRARELRGQADYEARRAEIEAEIAKQEASHRRLREDGDWLLGFAYTFFCPLFLGLVGAIHDFVRQRRLARTGVPGVRA